MSRRAARIASAIFVNILAGSPLVMLAQAEPVTADNCLASPKAETPAGSHWFYRTDHVNKRSCWYLRREDGSVAQAVPQPSQPLPAPQPAAKPSIADARAELRPRAAVREDSPTPLPTDAATPVGAAGNNAGSANTSVWNATAAVATRWPEVPPASDVAKPAAAAPDPAVNVAQADAAAPATASPAAAASPAASGVDLPVRPEMVPFVIAATTGALMFAGLAAFFTKRFRGRVRRRKASTARGPIWETTDDDRIVLSDYPAANDRDYRPRFARGVASAASRYRAPEVVQRTPRRAPAPR
jgi:hypothetical protein